MPRGMELKSSWQYCDCQRTLGFAALQSAASDRPMYYKRRQSIRDTWLPALAALPQVGHAFVVSKPDNSTILERIRWEEKTHGGPFIVLDTEVRLSASDHHSVTYR